MPAPDRVAVLGARHFLAHAPGLVRHGSKPSRDLARDPARLPRLTAALRSFEAAAAYPPHRAFLGALPPEALWELPRPWTAIEGPVEARGPYGHLVSETALYGLLKAADDFDLLWLTEPFAAEAHRAHASRGLPTADDGTRLGSGCPVGAVEARLREPGALPLYLGDGRLVGVVQAAHEADEALRAAVVLENLAAKATATRAWCHTC
jgi:betaine reductase